MWSALELFVPPSWFSVTNFNLSRIFVKIHKMGWTRIKSISKASEKLQLNYCMCWNFKSIRYPHLSRSLPPLRFVWLLQCLLSTHTYMTSKSHPGIWRHITEVPHFLNHFSSQKIRHLHSIFRNHLQMDRFVSQVQTVQRNCQGTKLQGEGGVVALHLEIKSAMDPWKVSRPNDRLCLGNFSGFENFGRVTLSHIRLNGQSETGNITSGVAGHDSIR